MSVDSLPRAQGRGRAHQPHRHRQPRHQPRRQWHRRCAPQERMLSSGGAVYPTSLLSRCRNDSVRQRWSGCAGRREPRELQDGRRTRRCRPRVVDLLSRWVGELGGGGRPAVRGYADRHVPPRISFARSRVRPFAGQAVRMGKVHELRLLHVLNPRRLLGRRGSSAPFSSYASRRRVDYDRTFRGGRSMSRVNALRGEPSRRAAALLLPLHTSSAGQTAAASATLSLSVPSGRSKIALQPARVRSAHAAPVGTRSDHVAPG